MKQTSFSRINTCMAWLVFAIAAIVYGLTVEPTASLWDCPEFIACGYKLEIGHPPGAPVFMLAANLFSQLASDPSHVALMVIFLWSLYGFLWSLRVFVPSRGIFVPSRGIFVPGRGNFLWNLCRFIVSSRSLKTLYFTLHTLSTMPWNPEANEGAHTKRELFSQPYLLSAGASNCGAALK